MATGAPPGLAQYDGEEIAALLPAEAAPTAPEVTPPPPEPPPPTEEPKDEGARPAEVDKDALTITLLLVIDRSGSMRGNKMAIAKAACMAAAGTLDKADRIGILAFDETNDWVYRPAAAGDRAGLARALMALDARGGTEIYAALKEAHGVIREEKSGIKHVILVSDGQDLLAGFKKLVSQMVSERITLSTVGVGADYETRLLGSLALWGKGRFYPADDPRELPRVVTLDTRRVIDTERPPPPGEASPDVTAGSSDPEPPTPEEPEQPPPADPVTVAAASPLPFLSGLSFPTLPEVEPVEPRFPAQTALVTPDGNPALTFWRFGEGRVAHFAGDILAWEDWEEYPRFLAQLCRQMAGTGEEEPEAGPDVTILDRRVIARTPEPPQSGTVLVDDRETALEFTRIGPGLYAADLPLLPAGALVKARVTGADGIASGAVSITKPTAEDRATGIDDAVLSDLARAGGNAVGVIPGAGGERRTPGREPVHLPLVIVALLLFPFDIAVRRVGK